jgi:hypothetical protein
LQLSQIVRRVGSAVLTRITLRGRVAVLADEWVLNEVDSLYRTCGFASKNEPFHLDPEVFDSVGHYRDQVVFLAKRHGLLNTDIAVYVHAGLKRGSRRCAGLAQYPVSFDTAELGANERLLSVNPDGTYAVIDSSDPERPIVRLPRTAISVSPANAAVFIDQAFLRRREGLGGIIAHEIAHLYLYDRGIHKPTTSVLKPIEEYRTDIAMFVMGLGLVALRAAAIDRIGYLSHRQMVVAQERVVALTHAAKTSDGSHGEA